MKNTVPEVKYLCMKIQFCVAKKPKNLHGFQKGFYKTSVTFVECNNRLS